MKNNKIQKFYNKLYTRTWGGSYDLQPSRNMRYHFFFKELKRLDLNLKDLKILDFGCGNGYLIDLLIREYNLNPENVFGYDISNKAIEIAKKYKGKFISSLSGLNEYFDIIICVDVIEHIKNDQKLIKNLNNLLKNGGHIILSTSSYNFYWNKMDDLGGHIRRYNLKELNKKFTDNYFSKKALYTYGFPFGIIYHIFKGWLSKINKTEEPQLDINNKISLFFIILLKKILIFNIPILGNQVIGVFQKIKPELNSKTGGQRLLV